MGRDLSRRDVLKRLLGATGIGTAIGFSSVAYDRTARAGARPVEKFRTALPIPPILRPVRSDATTDFYEVTERPASVEILPGVQTIVWGYDGQFPGPTIKARRGRKAVVRFINKLVVPTVVHLHGGVTPAESDGFPTDLIVPADFPADLPICGATPSISNLLREGKSRPPDFKIHEFPNDQRAATLWYHDHAMGWTGRNVYMGLAGFYLIEDPDEAALGLPSGGFDIPLMICVRQFDADGSLRYDMRGHLGAQGDVVLVNGAPWPRLAVQRRKYRFRILNAANASTFALALGSGRDLIQIATDAGLMAQPVAGACIPLAMAERVEVVIDFADYPVGSSVALQNLDTSGAPAEIMRFDVVGPGVKDYSIVPQRLAVIEPLRPESAVRTREFKFVNDFEWALNFPPVSWNINGKPFDPDRVDAAPPLGDVEIWRLVHPRTIFPGLHPHPAHLHLVHFQILERNGKPPPPHEAGWKDTVKLAEGDDVRIIARFDGHRGRYLLHCHNVEHEDHHMMARFDVV